MAGTGGLFPGDGGIATRANITYPSAEALDAAGNLFVASYTGGRIRKVGAGGIISTVAGANTNVLGDGGAETGIALPQGYRAERYDIAIHGRCPKCASGQRGVGAGK